MGGAWPLQWVTCMRFLRPRPHRQGCWLLLHSLKCTSLPKKRNAPEYSFCCLLEVNLYILKKEINKMMMIYIVTWQTAMTSCALSRSDCQMQVLFRSQPQAVLLLQLKRRWRNCFRHWLEAPARKQLFLTWWRQGKNAQWFALTLCHRSARKHEQ